MELPPDVKALGDQIRALKASLKASGLKAKDIKNHPQVAAMVSQLDQTKAQRGIDPKTNLPQGMRCAPKAPEPKALEPPSRALPPDLQGLQMQIKAVKDALRSQGLSPQQVKNHPQVAGLSHQLNQMIKARVPPKLGQATDALKPTIKAYEDQLTALRAQLRAQELTGQQADDHPQVVGLGAQIYNMKVSAGIKAAPPQQCMPPEIQALSAQMEALRSYFRASGMSGDQISAHPQVAGMAGQLHAMKVARGIKSTAPEPPLPPHIKAYSDQLAVVKAQLRAAGIKGDQLVNHPQVRQMITQLDQLKVQAGLQGASKTGSQQMPPHCKALNDQLATVKGSLKTSGLTTDQVRAHPQVQGMTAQLVSMLRACGCQVPKVFEEGVAPTIGPSGLAPAFCATPRPMVPMQPGSPARPGTSVTYSTPVKVPMQLVAAVPAQYSYSMPAGAARPGTGAMYSTPAKIVSTSPGAFRSPMQVGRALVRRM